jgi:hypothetical protein
MNTIPEHLENFKQPDVNWLVQGRIIPTSATGTEPVLYMQVRHQTWEAQHFHTGHCPIPADLAVEIAMSICVPFHPKLLAKSYTFDEQTRGLFYLNMARMLEPVDTIAFITVTGLTAMIKLEGVNVVFRYDNSCQECITQGSHNISEVKMDKLLEGASTHERSH